MVILIVGIKPQKVLKNLKMLMSRSSLKSLDVDNWNKITNLAFTTYPGAETCLENLFELKLRCDGDEKVKNLGEVSEKITSLRKITFNPRGVLSEGSGGLMTAQQNLRRHRVIKQANCR